MKRLLALICIILVALFYAACGGKPAAMPAMSGPAGSNGHTVTADYYVEGSSPQSGMTSTENLPKNKKIIRNAQIDLEVDQATKAYDAIREWAVSNGGYEYSSTTQKNDAYWTISAQLKIPPERLDSFITFAKIQGEMINCIVTSDDVSDQYVDTQSRLFSARKNLEKYYEFLAKAINIEETLRVQNEINNLTAEIEAFEGKLKYWDSQISESSVNLTIREKKDPVKLKREINWNALTFSDMLILMKNGIMVTTNILVTLIQWILIAAIAALPVAALVAVFFLVRGQIRKRKGLSKAKTEKNNQLGE